MTDEKPCYIYVMATVGGAGNCSPVKIGIASDPERRLANIQTSCPSHIRIQMFFGPMHRDYAKYIEHEAHRLYKKRCLHGEWFDADPCEAAEMISDLITVICTADVIDQMGASYRHEAVR